jgi:hypothetical protein
MTRIRTCVTGAATAVLLAGCMHHGVETQQAAGDISVDSLSATRTAILRVQNSYTTKVRVYTVVGGRSNEVASVMPNGVETVVMDPSLFPNASLSFEMRPIDGAASKKLGPYSVNKGETVELVITPDLDMAHAEIHGSTR